MSQHYQNLLNLYGSEIYRLYYDEKFSQVKIDEQLNLPKCSTQRLMKLAGWPVRSDREQALKFTCDEHYFDVIDTEEKAYWLGMMYTDGYIMKPKQYSSRKVGLSLGIKDLAHLEKFRTALSSNANIMTYKTETSFGPTEYGRILLSSEILAQGLIRNGCCENKTFLLTFPTEAIIPRRLMRHFVRGCIDGDGSLVREKPTGSNLTPTYLLKFCGTLEMVEGMKQFFCCEHLKISRRHKNRSNNNFQMTLRGNRKTFAALDLLYDNSTIYLERKYQQYVYYKHEYNEYTSRAIQ